MNTTDIFISYRREDEPAFAGRLFDLLKTTLPHHVSFIDVDAIPPGDTFTDHIISRIVKCSVFLPIIGPQWLYPAGTTSSRLFEDRDLVRKEIETALVCKPLIIPVLVNNTPMPLPNTIPVSISRLCALNAVRLSHVSFAHDAKPLIGAIKGAIPHHIQKHYTVGQVEAYELGKRLGKDMIERISRSIKVSFDHLQSRMVTRFMEEAAPIIANRDSKKLQNLIDEFGKEARYRKAELVVGTVDYVCEDSPHLMISPKEPDDPVFIAVSGQIEREFNELFLAMMDTIGDAVAKHIEKAGWRF